ncbi:MAG TPA: cyclic peptide export ABC transporter [Polyangium sp.]|nr:cyclic peptide export ABC transporter [Polyangium sp.]
MKILDFIAEESARDRWKILAMATMAGILNAFALMVVNTAAHTPEAATVRSFALYAPAAVISVLAARNTSRRTNEIIESALHRFKMRLVDKIERTPFERFERVGRAEILDSITENISVISTRASGIGVVLQSLCIFIAGLLYLLSLSPLTFAILCPLQVGAIYLFRSRSELLNQLSKESTKTRHRFLDTLMDLLKGAKEIRLHRGRSRDILDEFNRNSAKLGNVAAETNNVYDDNNLFVTINLYVLLGAIVFVIPKHVDLGAELTAKIVATLLFLWGSVQLGLSTYSAFVQSNEAIENIAQLEAKLDGITKRTTKELQTDPWSGKPGRIKAEGIEYEYPAPNGDVPFRIGPIDLTVEPGEIVFIVGGNGSGKSTLLKVLTGLYAPTHGVLQAGDESVLPTNAAMYREMISAIFADFHLFSKVYGMLDVDPEIVRGLLRDMHIEHKTSFENGEFTRKNLSTGQKKRLAMVIAHLEDRPLFVLDEWAADQDPEFRKHFYENMLPVLKRRGKTIIAVSHDDRYFHLADRVIVMEYGTIVHVTRKEVGS